MQANLAKAPYDVSPIYEAMAKEKKTVINYSNNNIGSNNKRTITIAQPVTSDGEFLGGIIWEQGPETYLNTF